MASQVRYAGSATSTGTGSAWVNTSFAVGDTSGNFSTGVATSGSTSRYLELTNYGFEIPTGATVDGISVRVRYYLTEQNAAYGSVNSLRLIKGGTISGNNKSTGQQHYTATILTLGNSTDMWGLTFTPAEINASNFGFSFRGQEEDDFGDDATFYVDWAEITVHYTGGEEPGGSVSKTKNFFMLVR